MSGVPRADVERVCVCVCEAELRANEGSTGVSGPCCDHLASQLLDAEVGFCEGSGTQSQSSLF